jgi:hypothetical protein
MRSARLRLDARTRIKTSFGAGAAEARTSPEITSSSRLPTQVAHQARRARFAVAYRLKLDGVVLGRSYGCHDAISVRKRVN